jgi:hypothetical protein
MGSARGADTLNASGRSTRLRKGGAQGSAAFRNRDSGMRVRAASIQRFLNRQAAQLQREAGSARLRSGAEAPGPTHKSRGVMALAGRSRRRNVSRGKRHAARDFVARPWRCSLR